MSENINYRQVFAQDPLFIEAQTWGAYPGMLVNEIERLGFQCVRRTIAYVSALGLDRLNRRGNARESIELKRWKYFRYCLKNGGVYEYKREYQQAKWEDR